MIDYQSQVATRTIAQAESITKAALASYDEARKAIITDINKLYKVSLNDLAPADRYNYMLKNNRLTTLLKNVDAQYAAYSKQAGAGVKSAINLSMSNAYYGNQYVLDWFSPVAGVGINYAPLPPALAETIVTGNMDAWTALSAELKRKTEATFGTINAYVPEGGTLSELLIGHRQTEVAKINQSITNGLLQGKGARSIGQDISSVIGAVTPIGASGAMANSIRIARTEGIRAMNAGAYANSQAVNSQGVNNEKIWISTLDLRTRDSHQRLDGTTIPLEENFQGASGSGPYPGEMGSASENINCRCRTGDIIDGVPPEIRRGINPETGESELFEWKSYDDWQKANGLTKKPNGTITPAPKKKPTPAPTTKKKPAAKAPAPAAKPKPKLVGTKTSKTPKTLEPSTTVKGANSSAIRNIKGLETAKYSGLTPEVADQFTQGLYDIQEKYGDLGIEHVSTYNGKSSGTYAFVKKSYTTERIPGGGVRAVPKTELRINTAKFKGPLEDVNSRIKWIKDQGHWASETVKEITIHEAGHALQFKGRRGAGINMMDGEIANIPGIGDGLPMYGTPEYWGSPLDALSEAFVLAERGEKVNDAVLGAMQKYMGVRY